VVKFDNEIKAFNVMKNNRTSYRRRRLSTQKHLFIAGAAILFITLAGQFAWRATVPLPAAAEALAVEAGYTSPSKTVYLPQIYKPLRLTSLPAPLPAPEHYVSGTAVHFPTAHATLQASGLILETNKIGFHVGPGGNSTGLKDNWWAPLDAAGVPVFLKSVDSGGPLYELQEQMKISGVDPIRSFSAAPALITARIRGSTRTYPTIISIRKSPPRTIGSTTRKGSRRSWIRNWFGLKRLTKWIKIAPNG
jgi:hypothetical protein